MLTDGSRSYDQKVAAAGSAHWIAWREVVVRVGHKREMQSVGHDVTAQIEAERALAEARDQAESANRAKSRFLAMISHEIRTPLTGVLGMASLLMETTLTPEQRTYAKAIKTSGTALLTLIEEILDFSKIEAGRLELEAKVFNLPDLIEETIELIAPRAHAKSLEIASYLDDELPREVVGDATRLRQALLNLAGNAIKFTEGGGVGVIVEPAGTPEIVRFLVCDSGIGIAPQAQDRIFLEFEQADDGRARRFDGSGLGLSITKRIVDRMGGRIGVESAPGAGSTFHITVPLPRSGTREEAVPTRPDLTGMDVLIAAPATPAASLIARRLGSWGARTCLVADEQVAMALLQERAWTSVLVDRAVGSDRCKRIIAVSQSIRLRAVLVTPSERPELPALAMGGITGYLVKPVRILSLAKLFGGGPDGFERSTENLETRESLAYQTRTVLRFWLPRTMRSMRCWRRRCYNGLAIGRSSPPMAMRR